MTTPLQKLYYGLLGIGGGLLANSVKQTTDYACDSGSVPDYVVMCNFSAGHAVTLPVASIGRVIKIKDISGTGATNHITILPITGTIDGASSYVLTLNYSSVELTSDGTNWFVTAEYNGTVI